MPTSSGGGGQQHRAGRGSLAEAKAALARDAAELGVGELAADESAAAAAAAFERLLASGGGRAARNEDEDEATAWRSQATGSRVRIRVRGSGGGGGGVLGDGIEGPTARGRLLYMHAQTMQRRRAEARVLEDAAIRAASNPQLSRCVAAPDGLSPACSRLNAKGKTAN